MNLPVLKKFGSMHGNTNGIFYSVMVFSLQNYFLHRRYLYHWNGQCPYNGVNIEKQNEPNAYPSGIM